MATWWQPQGMWGMWVQKHLRWAALLRALEWGKSDTFSLVLVELFFQWPGWQKIGMKTLVYLVYVLERGGFPWIPWVLLLLHVWQPCLTCSVVLIGEKVKLVACDHTEFGQGKDLTQLKTWRWNFSSVVYNSSICLRQVGWIEECGDGQVYKLTWLVPVLGYTVKHEYGCFHEGLLKLWLKSIMSWL